MGNHSKGNEFGFCLTMDTELISREKLEEQLKQAGLSQTEHHSDLVEVWKTETGQMFTIPKLEDENPDWVLESILKKVGRFYY